MTCHPPVECCGSKGADNEPAMDGEAGSSCSTPKAQGVVETPTASVLCAALPLHPSVLSVPFSPSTHSLRHWLGQTSPRSSHAFWDAISSDFLAGCRTQHLAEWTGRSLPASLLRDRFSGPGPAFTFIAPGARARVCVCVCVCVFSWSVLEFAV